MLERILSIALIVFTILIGTYIYNELTAPSYQSTVTLTLAPVVEAGSQKPYQDFYTQKAWANLQIQKLLSDQSLAQFKSSVNDSNLKQLPNLAGMLTANVNNKFEVSLQASNDSAAISHSLLIYLLNFAL